MIRIDFNLGRCDMLVSDEDIERRKADGIPAVPADATPWQRIYRKSVTQLSDGAVLEGAADFRQIAKNMPRTITRALAGKLCNGFPSGSALDQMLKRNSRKRS